MSFALFTLNFSDGKKTVFSPKQNRQQLKDRYLENVFIEKPAVININGTISSFAV